MVRVVDPNPQPEAVKQITCMNCGARLEYVKRDVNRYDGTDYGGGPAGREWIVCPQCADTVTIRSW